MKYRTIQVILLLVTALMAASVCAQPQGMGMRGGRGVNGDWIVKSDFNGRNMQTIYTFSRGEQGDLVGYSIGFMGMTELKDVTFEDGKLSFTMVRQGRGGGQGTESKFTGTIADGVLKGTMTGGRGGDRELTGERAPRIPRAAGQWAVKYNMGDREVTGTLIISADAEGNLTAKWPSDRFETTISDVVLERRDLSFKRTVKFNDREFASTFQGTLQANEITGTMKSERGDAEMTGTRIGSDLIGTWNLDVDSNFGETKQRLVVNPDLSGLYGAMPVQEIKLDGDKVSFKMSMDFGGNAFEMDFTGKIADGKLTGEISTGQGSQTVSGTKAPERRRGGMRMGMGG